jgi:hypothetical protein
MRLDMIVKNSLIYMKLPSALTSELPGGGRPWMKVDIGKVGNFPGLSSLESNPTTSDPRRMLDYLRSASGSVAVIDRERLNGSLTTHYRAQLSVAHLLDSLSSAGSAAHQAASQLQQALPGGQIPIDVWIDARSLIRRVRMTLDLNLPSGQSMQELLTTDIDHYGPQAAPATPPADQVMDLGALAHAVG